MSEDISHKVIDLFKRHRRGEPVHFEQETNGEMIISPDGFNYLSIMYENCGNNGEEGQLEVAASRHYIVKMMEVHHDSGHVRVNNYYIPGERLEEFLLSLPHRPGKFLEIKQLLPDHMA